MIEIGTEEIPSRLIPSTLDNLMERGRAIFKESRVSAKEILTYATPRRLVMRAVGLPKKQESQETEVIGPPRKAGYDAKGKPTPVAIGFAKARGASVSDLKIKKTSKGEYLYVVRKEASVTTIRVLKEILPTLLSSIKFPRAMRWDHHGLRFARPVRWILAVFDGEPVRFRLGGLISGNHSWGHRFIANRPFVVKSWNGYCQSLKRFHVILDPSERRRIIETGLTRLAQKTKGRADKDPSLVEQAVYLTEEPSVMLGRFDKRYLELPSEVLVTVMKEHQGYFPILDKKGKLMPSFLFVSNVKTRNPKLIKSGNERVLRARLEDARFYYEQDQKESLSHRMSRLDQLVFRDGLGSYYHKVERLGKLSANLLQAAGKNDEAVERVRRAAEICKVDLLTGMVREFPSLQGIMGCEYAKRQGEDEEVATAISEHYFPRHAEDSKDPKTTTGKFLTAADRLDTLVGFFGIGEIPTGSEDPYALRRHGMGLIQILLDNAFSNVSVREMIQTSVELYSESGHSLKKRPEIIGDELEKFLRQRMETTLRRRFEPEGKYRPDLADAVLSLPFDLPVDLYRRFVALTVFHLQEGFEALMFSFKRVSRIIPSGADGEVREERFKEKVEKDLYVAWKMADEQLGTLLPNHRYSDVLEVLARLRLPIDRFFDGVMVMDEDPDIRENRLALLILVRDLFFKYCDFTKVLVDMS